MFLTTHLGVWRRERREERGEKREERRERRADWKNVDSMQIRRVRIVQSKNKYSVRIKV